MVNAVVGMPAALGLIASEILVLKAVDARLAGQNRKALRAKPVSLEVLPQLVLPHVHLLLRATVFRRNLPGWETRGGPFNCGWPG